MAFTISQIDGKITETKAALKYWTDLRELVSDPRFEALEDENEASYFKAVSVQPAPATAAQPAAPSRPPYGLLKKLVLSTLPREGEGVTPQQLADMLAANGYNFVTKTPAISVNDVLQGLAAEDDARAKIVGKIGLSNLWVRIGL
jgi:hypothetical protein